MAQITLDIENPSAMKAIKELVKHMTGVSIVRTEKKKKTGFELAMEDVRAGRTTEYASVSDLLDAARK